MERWQSVGDGDPVGGAADAPPPDPPWALTPDDIPTALTDPGGPADDDPDWDLRPGDEPVPGYRLVARLGAGTTGVVWEAVGPGGFPSALKVTRLGPNRARELGSLDLVRGLRHAHLLPLFGAWERDGHLVVGMELADGTLADRLARAVRAGLPGLPFPELIEYMAQVARGIDFLNGAGRPGGGIRHCDIKPQNLLLVGDVVKVGDFGLARTDAEPGSDSARESLTPAFAAPELGRNRPSDRSDQYSLAVTYVLLRGGRLPFAGTAWSMLMDHAAAAPDLSMIPPAERPAVARALAKRPEDRWADCREFVRELARAGGGGAPPAARPRRRRRLVPAAAALLAAGLAAGLTGRTSVPDSAAGGEPAPRQVPTVRASGLAEPRAADAPPPRAVVRMSGLIPEPRPARVRSAPTDLGPLVAAARGLAGGIDTSGWWAARGVVGAVRRAARAAGDSLPAVRLPVALASGPRPVTEAVAVAPPPRAGPAARRPATIYVRMPAVDAELAVRGEVGRGNPDEWYGATRVIHTPPLGGPADYTVGAFWTNPAGRAPAPWVDLRVEPGRVYEVVLRGAKPTWEDVTDQAPYRRGSR
jgi:hypothetical protein